MSYLNKIKVLSEAQDIDDACDLARVWLTEYDPQNIIANAQSHIDDIYLYNEDHPAIPQIKNLIKVAKNFIKDVDDVIKELS